MNDEQQHKDLTHWHHFKNGDKSAYAHIYKEYYYVLFDYGVKIARDEAIAKDCIQQLFVKLWRNKANLGDPAGTVKQYLIKSLRRIIVREITSWKSDPYSHDNFQDTFDFQITISRESELIENQRLQEIKDHLESTLQYLTKRQKEAVYLKFYNKMSYDEIAEVMGLDKRSAYNLVSKAIETLRKNSNKYYWMSGLGLIILLSA